jgi:hypothetical protein
MSERMPNFFSFESKFWIRIQFSFHQISIFLDLRFQINFEILFQNIPNCEFKFIWSKSLTTVQISNLEKVQKISFKFKISFEFILFSSQKFETPFPILFQYLPQPTNQTILFPFYFCQQAASLFGLVAQPGPTRSIPFLPPWVEAGKAAIATALAHVWSPSPDGGQVPPDCKDRWPKRGVNWGFSNSNAEIKQPWPMQQL